MNQFQVHEMIEACLTVIKEEQLPDGGFLHQSWFEDSGSAADVVAEYKTTFFAANILACLNSIAAVFDYPELATIRESAARFLLAQKSEYGSFNYWAHGTGEALAMPYPDDLDDTCVALAALHGFDAGLVDGAAMAQIARMLTALETAPGGPYRTWLVKEVSSDGRGWHDVDVAVNSNVGYFLSRLGVALPKLRRFIDERSLGKNILSPYYPGEIQTIYFIARYYRGTDDGSKDIKLALANTILRGSFSGESGVSDTPGISQNPLEAAMAISALINLGCADITISERMEYLMYSIGRKKLAPYAFCIDPSRDGRICHAGSTALTAAFCAEAAARYSASIAMIASSQKWAPCASPSKILLSRIKMMARAQCVAAPGDLKALVIGAIDEVEDEQIVMVPYIMHHAIGAPRNIPSCLLDELALANFFGWIAYTIYDDFLDGEVGEENDRGGIEKLSAANFFLRELTLQYAALDEKIAGIRNEYIRVMNGIDDANAWEQMYCRIKTEDATVGAKELPYASRADLARLADRSLGHALPALGVLLAAGYSADSQEFVAILTFFRNYLTARQLQDDAHDWKEDLLLGRVNSVSARLIRLGSNHDIPTLQKIFWHQAIPDIVADIIFFLERAWEAIYDRAGNEAMITTRALFKNPAPFLELIDKLQSAAERTLRERDEAIKFLDVFDTTYQV